MTNGVIFAAEESSGAVDLATVVIAGLALIVAGVSAAFSRHAIVVSRQNALLTVRWPAAEAWIDGLRADLATYPAIAHEMTSMFRHHEEQIANRGNHELPERYLDLAAKEDQLRSQILMRLDRKEPLQADLADRLEAFRAMDGSRLFSELRDELAAAAERVFEHKRAQVDKPSLRAAARAAANLKHRRR